MRAENKLDAPAVAAGAQNIVQMLLERAQKPAQVAAAGKVNGTWQDVTWGKVLDDVAKEIM